MKSSQHKNYYFFEVFLLLIGGIVGVFFCQISYFDLDKKISLSDLLIFSLTSITALYIANNINKNLTRLSSIKALYQEDIKSIISYSKQLEDWIDACNIPTSSLISHLKQGNIKLRTIEKLYSNVNEINTSTIPDVIIKYNTLKADITNLNTSQNGLSIILLPSQSIDFQNKFEEIKLSLLSAIINS